MAIITIDEDEIVDGEIDVDISDYLDEVDTEDLVKELIKRRNFKISKYYNESRTPIRDSIIDILDLHTCATLEEIQEEVKNIYYK